MPIPGLDPATGNLPRGVHDATWQEIVVAFGTNQRREELVEGLLRALRALKAADCRRAYVDGSFVTSKDAPGDYDGCWEAAGVDAARLDPVLLDFTPPRAAQKASYGGELFPVDPSHERAGTGFLDFFQTDKATGERKGIIAIDLEGLP